MPAPTQIPVGGGTGITWMELIDSDSGEVSFNAPRSERKWLVTGTLDINDIISTEPGNNIPLINPRGNVPHVFKGFKYNPTAPTSGTSWLIVASYEFQVDYFELSFDTSGATEKREQALESPGDYYYCTGTGGKVTPGQVVPGGTATVPDYKGIVLDGVDVPGEKFDFSVLIRSKYSTLPASYIDSLRSLTGHCNDRAIELRYKGQSINFTAEELLFLGCPGKVTSEDGFEFTLKFSASRSVNAKGGTKTTASYVQPATSSTVIVAVLSTTSFANGDTIYISNSDGTNGGKYSIQSVDSGTQLTLFPLTRSIDASAGTTIPTNSLVAFETGTPLSIGESGPIKKLGWRYLKATQQERLVSGKKIPQPEYVIVNKVIRTADLGQLGIFA